MNRDIVLVECFSGIGGFAKGLIDAGFNITNHLFSEIDQHAIANYKYNFPDAEYIGSVNDVSGTAIRERFPDKHIIVVGGFPCQDLSISGKRLGFKGKRSSLFYHLARIIRECQADNYIWENVQGLLSSNNGDDISAVFEEMYLSGYVFDIEELNTSWVLPQNRVRLYSVGYNIKYLQKCLIETSGQNQNYSTCVKIIEGILLTKYPSYLTEVLNPLEQKRKDLELGYLTTIEQSRWNGRNLKKKFLEIILGLQLIELQNLSQDIQFSPSKQKDIDLDTTLLMGLCSLLMGIKSVNMVGDQEEKVKLITSIEKLLSELSEDLLQVLSKFIILILIDKTTQKEIFSYVEMQRNIDLLTIQLNILYPNCWKEALSNLIEKKKNINYATKNRNNKRESSQENDSNAFPLSDANGKINNTTGFTGTGCRRNLFSIREDDKRPTKGPIDTTTVRTITGGGNSGGMHSSMTLLRVSTTEEQSEIQK